MGTTTTEAIPYPEPSDPVQNGAAAIKALAQRLDFLIDDLSDRLGYAQADATAALVRTGPADTGWVTTGFGAPAANWTASSLKYRIRNGWVHVQGRVTYAAAAPAITVPADGDITNQAILTVPQAAVPTYAMGGQSSGTGPVASFLVAATTGQLSLTAVAPGTVLGGTGSAAKTFDIYLTYPANS